MKDDIDNTANRNAVTDGNKKDTHVYRALGESGLVADGRRVRRRKGANLRLTSVPPSSCRRKSQDQASIILTLFNIELLTFHLTSVYYCLSLQKVTDKQNNYYYD